MHATLAELQWRLEHLMFLSFSPSFKELAPWTLVQFECCLPKPVSVGNLISTFGFMKSTKGLVEDDLTQNIKGKIYTVFFI